MKRQYRYRGYAARPSSGQTDGQKGGSTITEEIVEVVSGESADMRGGGSEK